MTNITEKLEALRALLETSRRQKLIDVDHYTPEQIEIHRQSWTASIKLGRKYANVDCGGSGCYMVELDTGRIYGIKAYGVIHRGHAYGDLDTIADFDWSGYRAQLRKSAA